VKIVRPISLTLLEIEALQIEIQEQIEKSVHRKTAELIGYVNRILEENKQFGRVTVRQVYYQLVSRGVIENSKKSYANFINHLTTGRKAGVIPWDAFEDRSRIYHKEPTPKYDIHKKKDPQRELEDWFQYALDPQVSTEYDLPIWFRQPYYIELWVEKDALAGFLSPICEELGVSLVVSRGYTSYTFKEEAKKRFLGIQEMGREPVLLYLGDLDPSGYDIFRCLKEEMGIERIFRIGLHPEDVKQYGLVSNPIKDGDLRSNGFKKMFPELEAQVYELDALPPGELMDRARRNILKYFDGQIFKKNQHDVRHWRAAFTDYQDRIRELLKDAGLNIEN